MSRIHTVILLCLSFGWFVPCFSFVGYGFGQFLLIMFLYAIPFSTFLTFNDLIFVKEKLPTPRWLIVLLEFFFMNFSLAFIAVLFLISATNINSVLPIPIGMVIFLAIKSTLFPLWVK